MQIFLKLTHNHDYSLIQGAYDLGVQRAAGRFFLAATDALYNRSEEPTRYTADRAGQTRSGLIKPELDKSIQGPNCGAESGSVSGILLLMTRVRSNTFRTPSGSLPPKQLSLPRFG